MRKFQTKCDRAIDEYRAMSTRRTQVKQGDLTKILWTVMYWDRGESLPHCPDDTGIPLDRARQRLTELRQSFPRGRFCLTPTAADHITVAQSRKVLKGMFTEAGRQDLVAVARKARSADVRILANVAFDEKLKAERKLALDRTNEQRKMNGLPPIPGMPVSARPEPEITTRNGRVLVHLGTRV